MLTPLNSTVQPQYAAICTSPFVSEPEKAYVLPLPWIPRIPESPLYVKQLSGPFVLTPPTIGVSTPSTVTMREAWVPPLICHPAWSIRLPTWLLVETSRAPSTP